MNDIKRLPDSELEIMMIVWDAKEKVTSDFIMEKLSKSWARTTVLNFLARLCDRGFLSCTKKGRHNIYSAQVKKEDYLKRESRSFLQKLYHGSLTGLVASLYDGKIVSKEELEELKRYIEEAE